MAITSVRVMVPRVRRALEGAGAPETLTSDTLKDLVADAASDVLMFSGSLFGKELLVTERDDTSNAPTEYATSDELTLAEQSVIAAQAALTYFFFQFANLKISETIGDEGSNWEYTLSAQLLRDQLKMLQTTRDAALASITWGVADSYVSFVAARDVQTSRYVEPWVAGDIGVGGGLETDYRFGGQ